MSHTLMLPCGCLVYVACNPLTGVAHTRVIEKRGASCGVRAHRIGARIFIWEILPERKEGVLESLQDAPGRRRHG
jgi:hypothetical protein